MVAVGRWCSREAKGYERSAVRPWSRRARRRTPAACTIASPDLNFLLSSRSGHGVVYEALTAAARGRGSVPERQG